MLLIDHSGGAGGHLQVNEVLILRGGVCEPDAAAARDDGDRRLLTVVAAPRLKAPRAVGNHLGPAGGRRP